MCEIYDDGDRSSVWNETTRKAAKPHRCESCGAVILPGETYRYTSGVHDHRGFSERGCTACALVRDAFGKVHSYYPAMYDLASTLRNCIADGDDESLVWKEGLDALLARNESARAAEKVTEALVGWLEERKAVS